jgi:hypothetical protein
MQLAILSAKTCDFSPGAFPPLTARVSERNFPQLSKYMGGNLFFWGVENVSVGAFN